MLVGDVRGAGGLLALVVAVASSIALELEIVLFSGFALARDYLYGAPIPVGTCHNDALLSTTSGCNFSPALFAVDVTATALVLLVCLRFGGLIGMVPGTVAAAIIIWRFPRAPDSTIDLVPMWLVAMVAALLVSGAWTALSPRLRGVRGS